MVHGEDEHFPSVEAYLERSQVGVKGTVAECSVFAVHNQKTNPLLFSLKESNPWGRIEGDCQLPIYQKVQPFVPDLRSGLLILKKLLFHD